MTRRGLVVNCLVCLQMEIAYGGFEEKDDQYFTARE
jgi:hypothetical protein